MQNMLDAVDLSSESKQPSLSSSNQAKDAAPETATPTILVVDDTMPWLRLANEILSSGGYQVHVCENSPDALRLFRSTPEQIALVITDLHMPCMNGLELAAELRRIRPSLPVVLTSSAMVEITTAKLQALGVCGFLAKPWQREQLFTLIEHCLASARQN